MSCARSAGCSQVIESQSQLSYDAVFEGEWSSCTGDAETRDVTVEVRTQELLLPDYCRELLLQSEGHVSAERRGELVELCKTALPDLPRLMAATSRRTVTKDIVESVLEGPDTSSCMVMIRSPSTKAEKAMADGLRRMLKAVGQSHVLVHADFANGRPLLEGLEGEYKQRVKARLEGRGSKTATYEDLVCGKVRAVSDGCLLCGGVEQGADSSRVVL